MTLADALELGRAILAARNALTKVLHLASQCGGPVISVDLAGIAEKAIDGLDFHLGKKIN